MPLKMRLLGRKGQATNDIVNGLVVLMIVGFIGLVSVTIYSDIDSSMVSTSSTTNADMVIGNFTENFYDGQDLASNIPVVLAAGLLLATIIGFAMYVRG